MLSAKFRISEPKTIHTYASTPQTGTIQNTASTQIVASSRLINMTVTCAPSPFRMESVTVSRYIIGISAAKTRIYRQASAEP